MNTRQPKSLIINFLLPNQKKRATNRALNEQPHHVCLYFDGFNERCNSKCKKKIQILRFMAIEYVPTAQGDPIQPDGLFIVPVCDDIRISGINADENLGRMCFFRFVRSTNPDK